MLVKNAALTTVPMTPTIGSRVEIGVDALLSGDHADEIKALLEERGVLIFPQIDLNDEQQLIFTETIGTQVDEYVGYMREDGERERIFKVSLDENVAKTAKGLQNSFFWHLDGSMQEVPIMASVLTAKKLSETGGDTEFCSTYAAYEALPEEDKQALEGLRVVHAAWALQRNADPQPSYEDFVRQRNGPSRSQPLVWKHRSGRNSLVIGATAAYIEGMDYLDSLDLLIRLRDWATQPRFVFRHKWTKGDMVMWDNTGTLHRVRPFDLSSGRLMHRFTLLGHEPVRGSLEHASA